MSNPKINEMKVAELNDYLMYDGRLHKVVGIMTGKTIIMEPIIESENGRMLGERYATVYVLEHSPRFQDGAEPVGTLQEDCLKANANDD
jgi:hypothetical protein